MCMYGLFSPLCRNLIGDTCLLQRRLKRDRDDAAAKAILDAEQEQWARAKEEVRG